MADEGWVLDHGSHARPEDGVCLMEAVAWVAGEPHSDMPECACPVLGSFGIALNDWLSHRDRQQLAQFVPRLVASRAIPQVEIKRAVVLAQAARDLAGEVEQFVESHPTLFAYEPLRSYAAAVAPAAELAAKHAEEAADCWLRDGLKPTRLAMSAAAAAGKAFENADRAGVPEVPSKAIEVFSSVLAPVPVLAYQREAAACPAWRAR